MVGVGLRLWEVGYVPSAGTSFLPVASSSQRIIRIRPVKRCNRDRDNPVHLPDGVTAALQIYFCVALTLSAEPRTLSGEAHADTGDRVQELRPGRVLFQLAPQAVDRHAHQDRKRTR